MKFKTTKDSWLDIEQPIIEIDDGKELIATPSYILDSLERTEDYEDWRICEIIMYLSTADFREFVSLLKNRAGWSDEEIGRLRYERNLLRKIYVFPARKYERSKI